MTLTGRLAPPPQALLEPLLELRDYYATRVSEYERLWQAACSQLAHVKALLSNWSKLDAYGDNQTTVEAVDETLKHLYKDSLFIEQPQDINTGQEKPIQSVLKDNGGQEIVLHEELSHNVNAPDTLLGKSPQAEVSLVLSNDNLIKRLLIPMLPQYQALTRMEAIEKLLLEHIGTVCHIDFVVRSLYGELESNVFKVVKGRVQSSLTHGKEKNYWTAISDEPGCYTLDLSLIPPRNDLVKSQTLKHKQRNRFILPKTKRVPMLIAFEGQFLIDAISSFLQQNPGQIFTVSEVITGLYGELDSTQIREIKTAVHNELSRGHRIGRFSRFPDKIGCYTWDLNVCSTQSLTAIKT